MTFLHKLARRLAGFKPVLLMSAVAAIACEIPVADPSSSVARLLLSPKALTLHTGQMTQFVVVALTPAGDTTTMGVHWSATGGSIVDTSTTGTKHFLQYRSPNQPGQYKVMTQGLVAGLADSAIVNVSAVPVASVSVSPSSANVIAGQTVQLTANPVDSTGAALSGRVVTWASSNSGIATVNANGLVSGVSAGSVAITATSEGKSGTSAVTVAPAPVASVSVAPTPLSMVIGQTVQLTATPRDANGNVLVGRVVTWASGNTGLASVNASGLVTGIAVGLLTITATSEGKNGTAAITVTLTAAPVASVTVSPASPSIVAGQTFQLSATPRDAAGNVLVGRVVAWATSDFGVATVSGSGLVTGVGAGTATITASTEGQDGTAAVTVTVPVASVSVTPVSTNVMAGQTVQLTATPRDASGNALTGRVVTWSSNNTGRATVNGNGLVTGVSAGAVTITATSEGKSGTSAVTVTPVPVASVSVSPTSPSVSAGLTVQLTATTRDASGNVLTGRVVTWASSNNGIATVNGNGLVTGVTAGSVTITATSEGINGTATVTVTPAPPPPPGGAWPNEPAGYTTVTDFAFDNFTSSGWNTNPGPTIATDPTAPRSPSNVAQWFYPQGFSAGSSPGTVFYPANMTDHYVGYYFKYSNGYSNQVVGTKQWYPYGSSDYFVLFNSSSKMQVDLQVPAAQGGSYNLYANVNDPTITLGAWHRFELLFKRSSSPSTADGIVRWWIDGVLCGNYTNVMWPSTGFDEMRFAPTWGGIGGTVAVDSYWWVDHIRISHP